MIYLGNERIIFIDSQSGMISLKARCIKYIVEKFDIVDSLVGLPEIIGKELFAYYVKQQPCICSNEPSPEWQRDMTVFASAFKQNILQAINLSGYWLFSSLQIEHLFPFLHLEELDISSCKVGNHHEILLHVGKLEFLKKLSLKDNNLTGDGIKNLTLCRRRAGKGLSKLKYLKLDLNKIETIGFNYLRCLPLLKVLTVDKEELNIFDKNNKLLFSLCNSLHDHDFDNFMVKSCKNHGWAIDLLQNCIESTRKVHNKRTSAPSKRFYKKRKVSTNSSKLIIEHLPKTDNGSKISFAFCNNSAHHAQVSQMITLRRTKMLAATSMSALSSHNTFTLDPHILDIYSSN